MTPGNLLVVGARKGSLGYYVAEVARDNGWAVTTAGINDENIDLDITSAAAVEALFGESPERHAIVCTAGINQEGSIAAKDIRQQLDLSMLVNCEGPLYLLHCWAEWWLHNLDETYMQRAEDGGPSLIAPEAPMHFVAVSSNSAHVARSQSLAYCASKAALSMGIRCAARELAGTWLNVWGVEPGWLSGTPMSKEVNQRFEYGMLRHRIPGDRTVDPAALAHLIVGGLRNPYSSLNGCMLRLDGGEQ